MKIIISGDFYDCQIIRGRIFLWDTYGWLRVLDIRSEVQDLIKKNGKRFEFTIHKDVVDKFVVSFLRMKGGIFPLDSAYMGSHLYTATESGLYRRYLQNGEKIGELSRGLAKKLVDIRFMELAAGTDMMAMAGESEGIFELYNPSVYRIAKSGHQPKEIEKGIYSVIKTYSKSVWYEDSDIASESENGNLYLYRFRTGSQPDNQGRKLRTYIRQESVGENLPPRLTVRASRLKCNLIEPEPLNDKPNIKRHVYEWNTMTPDRQTHYCFAMFSDSKPVDISSKPRRYHFGEFGIAAESRKELVVIRNNQSVIRIDGPITRARVVSGFGRKNNLLVTVCNDYVLISDCEDA